MQKWFHSFLERVSKGVGTQARSSMGLFWQQCFYIKPWNKSLNPCLWALPYFHQMVCSCIESDNQVIWKALHYHHTKVMEERRGCICLIKQTQNNNLLFTKTTCWSPKKHATDSHSKISKTSTNKRVDDDKTEYTSIRREQTCWWAELWKQRQRMCLNRECQTCAYLNKD